MFRIGKAIKLSSDARKYRVQYSQELRKYGLSYTQLECLYEISKAKCYPSHIANNLFHQRATISRVVKELGKKRLVSYHDDIVDRRQVHVEITNKGKSLLSLIEAALN